MALSRRLIKIRTSTKPGSLTLGKALLSDQIETTSHNLAKRQVYALSHSQPHAFVQKLCANLHFPIEPFTNADGVSHTGQFMNIGKGDVNLWVKPCSVPFVNFC